MRCLAPLALVVLTVAVDAQTRQTVVPAEFATKDGNTLARIPFGWDRARYAHYTDASLLAAIGARSVLTAVSYRRDMQVLTQVFKRVRNNVPKVSPAWRVYMINYAGSWSDPPELFNNNANRGLIWTEVFINKRINFPDLARPDKGLPPFAIRFPLDRPYTWTGGTLGIQHRVHEGRGYSYSYFTDALSQQIGSGRVEHLAGAVSCPAGKNRGAGAVSGPGGPFELSLFSAPASTSAWATLGVSSTRWASLTLPFNLAVIGAPNCFVYNDVGLAIPVRTNALGTGRFRTTLPTDSSLANSVLYTQWAVSDKSANSLGLATSAGLKLTIGASKVPFLRMSETRYEGSGNVSVGFRSIGQGPVFRLEWR